MLILIGKSTQPEPKATMISATTKMIRTTAAIQPLAPKVKTITTTSTQFQPLQWVLQLDSYLIFVTNLTNIFV